MSIRKLSSLLRLTQKVSKMTLWQALFPLATLTFSASCGAAQAVQDPPQVEESALDVKLTAGLPEILETSGIASVSVAHIEGGRVVAMHAAGQSAPGELATIETRYNVASLTKPVSAEVVLRLVSEGLFSLDQAMSASWIDPDVADDPRHEELTPRLALNHQTGFPNWRDANGLRFHAEPGSSPGYSGEGYEYVARFISQLTGAGIDQHAERLLFKPLEMGVTSYTTETETEANVAHSWSKGVWATPVTRHTPSAADDLITSVGDYARFLIALMRNDALSPELAIERARVQADKLDQMCAGIRESACPDSAGPALGWTLFVIEGTPYYMHTGADSDGFSLAYWTPSSASGTVILTNSEHGNRAILPVLDLLGANPKFVDLLREQASR